MKSTMIKSIFTAVVAVGVGNSFAQDIHFSQFDMAPLQQNPALAGALYGVEANINYKDQWRTVGAPYKTFAFGYDMRLTKKRMTKGFMAMGFHLFADKAGDSKMGTTQGNFSLGYHVQLDKKNTLGAAIQPGFFQRSIDFSGLQWGNQYDGMQYNYSLSSGEMQGTTSFTKYDLGAGLLWTYNNTAGDIHVTDNHDINAHAGFSVFHLTTPKYSFLGSQEDIYMKFVLHGGLTKSLGDSKVAIQPSFFYYRQGPAQEIYFGSMFRFLLTQDSKFTGFKSASAFYLGGYYRTRDAVTLRILYEYAGWGFGVSYDVNTSSLKDATNTRGGLELSLRLVTSLSNNLGSNHSRY